MYIYVYDINIPKTFVMLFCSSIHLSYSVGNSAVTETNSFKDPSITYSNLYVFDEHIVNIYTNAKFVSHLLFCTFRNQSVEFYETLHATYVRPILKLTLQFSLHFIFILLILLKRQFKRRILQNLSYYDRLQFLNN